ncbi:autotransporter-associated beta strand repeat-containing protein [Prosthecobacter sp. SYSU 5D2]|uniref:beta strand repeat-containing protein n=1 Tax=Prosthecobacter sp. SYSU 5D2 TaxID=3134134 RepID=UPI0031FE9448
MLTLPTLVAQTPVYIWDGNPATAGVIDNTAGNWTAPNWYDGTGYQTWNPAAIAQFGAATSSAGAAITVNEAITLAGMNFRPFTSLPSANRAYSFTGTGSLNFTAGSIIDVASGTTNGSSGFITFAVPLVGNDLTFSKADGTALGYMTFSAASPDLTGTLFLKTTGTATAGIYASIVAARFTGLDAIDIEAGSMIATSGAGNFDIPLIIAGNGGSQWGAIRVGSSSTNFTEGITLSGDARFHTHINVNSTTVSSVISETAGGSKAFNRTAFSPVNTLLPLAATFTAANTFTGNTILGRTFNLGSTSETSATEGGLTILDFSATGAPANDIFYNGTAKGGLIMNGGLATTTKLHMTGKSGTDNSQTFSSLHIQQGANAIEAFSATGGSITVALGDITRTEVSSLAIRGPASGSITGTLGGSGNGFIGPWATYTTADGSSATWASLKDGAVSAFTGETEYETGTLLSSDASSHLRISSLSTGDVSLATGTTTVGTFSMTDAAARQIGAVTDQTLRLGVDGGIQMINGAASLTVGIAGQSSTLTAGGADDTAGQVILTNLSSNGTLMVNSSITNNGSGAVSLMINGTGRTILTAASSFTGMVGIYSGVLEIRDSLALGTTTGTVTKVITGASLNLAGDLTLAESLQINGHGIASDGAIRNLSGTNTITSLVRVQSSSRISSDSGTLILSGGISATNSGTSVTFSGAGDIEMNSNITTTSGLLIKDGPGSLTLRGTSTATGNSLLNMGRLHLDFSGTTAPASNILYSTAPAGAILSMGNGSMLELTGKSGATNSQTFTNLTLTTAGSYRISANQNDAASLSLNFNTLTRPAAALVRFDLPTTGSFTTTSGVDNAILATTTGIPYATVGLNDWAATTAAVSSRRNIVGLSSLDLYTPSTFDTLSGHADAIVPLTTLTADASISTLRFNLPQATTITQDAPGRTLTTGGILVTPEVGAHDTTISTSVLRPGTGNELVIIQNNTQGVLNLVGKINNNTAGGTTALVKDGPGTVVIVAPGPYLTGENYSGDTRIQNGTLQLTSGTGAAITYPVYHSASFVLGSGSNSGKLVLGSGTVPITQYGGLFTQGTGTANAVVGGSTAYSTFLTYRSGTFDFRTGFLGGPGENENNLNLTISVGTTQLGPVNTYKGKTSIARNTVEVTSLADTGMPSSLGTGDFNAAAAIIDFATATTSAVNVDLVATLRYIGDGDSVTNRPLNMTNSDVIRDTRTVTMNLENTGHGTVKFTSPFTTGGNNLAPRTLRLGGSNTGANEIVSISNATNVNVPGLILEKFGTGTWVMTGSSTHTGGTLITEGTLLTRNDSLPGSATGLGAVAVSAGATLGGTGRIAPAADLSITLTGGTLSIGDSTLETLIAGKLEILTSGTGGLLFEAGSILALDLFSGAGSGMDQSANPAAADLLTVSGTVDLGTGTLLQVGNPNGMSSYTYGDQWQLFDWSGLAGPVQGTFADTLLPTLNPGHSWDLSPLYTGGFITVVPEPSRALLLLCAMVGLCILRRR